MKHLFNKKDRATARRLLKDARSVFDGGQPTFFGVCMALDDSVNLYVSKREVDRQWKVVHKIQDEISKRLEGSSYVTTWLSRKTGMHYDDDIKPHQNKYRQLWIDSMIQELKD